jgi:small subunit ribosomal protein S6
VKVKEYELVSLIHPDLEMNLEPAIDKVRAIVHEAGGKVVKEDGWGKKKLAYQIKGQDFGIYQYFELELPADAPLKISNILNITDEVIRYLLVKKDEKVAPKAKSEEEE